MAGWGPGQKELPMGKQGSVTFVPFVSPGCLKHVRLPAGPFAGPLRSGAWALALATVSLPFTNSLMYKTGTMEENELQGGMEGEWWQKTRRGERGRFGTADLHINLCRVF